MQKIIMLADMESFYKSVEVAKNPSPALKTRRVCGDPEQETRNRPVPPKSAGTKQKQSWLPY